MTAPKVSESAVRRLSLYLRSLTQWAEDERPVVSSRELAEESGTTPAQVRKDLSLFGSFGKRGRGYEVEDLRATLESILGLQRTWPVALVGAGKIGTALLDHPDLERRGFRIEAAFDSDPAKVGSQHAGVRVEALSRMAEILPERGIDIGIIATPPAAAQETADRLVEAGLTAILNFAPVRISVPAGVIVRGMDVALELEGLTFFLSRRDRGGAAGRGA